jgi:hypothetical protein
MEQPMSRHQFLVLCLAIAVFATPSSIAVAQERAAKSPVSSVGVPSNYRQLVARRLATNKYKVIKAEISRPGEGWMGLFNGGNRPMVCARVTFQGPLIQQTYVAGFTFEKGQIADVIYPGGYNPMGGALGAALQSALTCDKFSYGPFPELAKAR